MTVRTDIQQKPCSHGGAMDSETASALGSPRGPHRVGALVPAARHARKENIRVKPVFGWTASLVLAWTAIVHAQPAPLRSTVVVKTVDDTALGAELLSISLSEGAILRAEDGLRRVPIGDIVRITSTVPPSPHNPNDSKLTLAGGDVLYGRFRDGGEDTVAIETNDLGRLLIPLDVVAAVDHAKASSKAYTDMVQWADRDMPDDQDQLLLTNGDVMRGFITRIDAEGFDVEMPAGLTKVPHRLVLAARFPSPIVTSPQQLHAIVTLRGSGRLTVSELDWSNDSVTVRLIHGPRVRIEPNRIVRIDVVGGRWEWLSLHRPISFQHTPLISLDWAYAVDRNVLGGPITVAGETFEHGVGVHSRSRLTYDLKGRYREFVTHFGIDDDSGPYADVSVHILVDGQRRFKQEHVRPGKLHGPIRLDVADVGRIELVVDFGDNGDLQDRLDWVDAALIR